MACARLQYMKIFIIQPKPTHGTSNHTVVFKIPVSGVQLPVYATIFIIPQSYLFKVISGLYQCKLHEKFHTLYLFPGR